MNIAGYHFLLGAVHFPSKLYHGEEDADSIGERLHRDIQIAEKEAGHEKIILVGDFNANPFEQSIVAANRLHAIFDSAIVEENRFRMYMDRKEQIFYNPSWDLLGETHIPKGSCFYSGGGRYQIYWNLYDQVIMSADFIPAYCQKSLRLITGTRVRRFLDMTGRPDTEIYSDHLPLIFNFQGVTV